MTIIFRGADVDAEVPERSGSKSREVKDRKNP